MVVRLITWFRALGSGQRVALGVGAAVLAVVIVVASAFAFTRGGSPTPIASSGVGTSPSTTATPAAASQLFTPPTYSPAAPTPSPTPSPSPTPVPTPTPLASPVYRGMAVDSGGSPIASATVLTTSHWNGMATAFTFATATAADGTFTIPCPTAPIVVSAGTFTTNFAGNSANTANDIPTFVGDPTTGAPPACTTDPTPRYLPTTLGEGASVGPHVTFHTGASGSVTLKHDCPLGVFCDESRVITQACCNSDVAWDGLAPGTYTFTASPGCYQSGTGKTSFTMTLRAGDTELASFDCYTPPPSPRS